jgi:hypothetical protein
MASTYLTTSKSTPTNQFKWTFSGWFKLSDISNANGGGNQVILSDYTDASNRGNIFLESNDELVVADRVDNSNVLNYTTTRKFKDPNAWYHIVVSHDRTLATPETKIYVNGVEETSFSTSTNPSQNGTSYFNKSGQDSLIGKYGGGAEYYDGLMTHVHFIDGTAYDASTFGETDATTGIWKPKTAPSVTYGTNGFFLKFESSGSMGLDSSGNANNFTVSGNLTQTVDTPSNVFVTFNPLDTTRTSSSTPLFQNGNTTAYNAASDGSYLASAMAVNKGKWYAEFKVGAGANTRNFGILDVTSSLAYIGNPASGNATNSYAYNSLSSGGLLRDGNTTIASSVGTTTNGDIVSVMIDLDSATKTIKFQKNGVDLSGTTQMTISQSSDTYWIFALRADNDQYVYANFGNGYFGTTAVSSATTDESGLGIFEYTVPSGYYALCTKNINEQG